MASKAIRIVLDLPDGEDVSSLPEEIALPPMYSRMLLPSFESSLMRRGTMRKAGGRRASVDQLEAIITLTGWVLGLVEYPDVPAPPPRENVW